jgi:hypothetical protein
MSTRFVVTAAVLLYVCFGSSAQTRGRDPHLADALQGASLDDYVRVDDMLFRPEQYAELLAPPRLRSQAYPSGYGTRFVTWDAGVIPYEIAPNFTATERQRILTAMTTWSRVAPVTFVPRTTQRGALAITRDDESTNGASTCWSTVGQRGRATSGRLNLGGTCASSPRTVHHEMGHSLGLNHEHQRPDRDDYVSIDLGNVPTNAHFAFNKFSGLPLVGPYDFASVMHYDRVAFAIDRSRLTIIPHPPYSQFTTVMGQAEPSETDHNVMALFYNAPHRESDIRVATESVRTRFEREDFLVAMERLHALYMSRVGLHRPQGLSIDGRPDFLGIAQWIFDVYLPARSGGFSSEGAFDIVIASVTRTDEWRQKNPGRASLTPSSFRGTISFSRDEFLDVLNRLDRFYAAPEGLQRRDGLSIGGGPDFLGIATWIFDVYLNQRLTGGSPNAAWQLTENAIRSTDEWRSKH